MRKKDVSLLLSFVFLLSLVVVTPVFAQAVVGKATGNLDTVRGLSGVAKTDLPTAAGEVVRLILLIVGGAFFGLMVYGGITWITAQGEDDKIEAARGTIVAATIGLLITVGSFAVTTFITNGFLKDVKPTGSGASSAGSVQTTVGEGNSPLVCCLLVYKRNTGSAYQTSAYMATQEQCNYDGAHPVEGEQIVGVDFKNVADATQCTPNAPKDFVCCITRTYDANNLDAPVDRKARIVPSGDQCVQGTPPAGKQEEVTAMIVSQRSQCQ